MTKRKRKRTKITNIPTEYTPSQFNRAEPFFCLNVPYDAVHGPCAR